MLLSGRRLCGWPALFSLMCLLGVAGGCASPGAPKPPSLGLPEPVRDLTATRVGDLVELRFSVPSRTTDGLLLRSGPLQGVVCRQVTATAPCQAIAPAQEPLLQIPGPGSSPALATWTDRLTAQLATGPARILGYRLELRNAAGHSAGYSDPAFTGAGAAPPEVQAFTAQGTRKGVLLTWTPVPGGGEILLQRKQLDLAPAEGKSGTGKGGGTVAKASSRFGLAPARPRAEPGVTWLQAQPGNPSAAQTMDGTVVEGVRYRYMAVRRTTAQVGGRTVELRSAPSNAAEIAWHDVYPPAMPQGLTAAGFRATSAGQDTTATTYAVDLIWQPVEDPRVTGYLVSRTAMSAAGKPQGAPERLTAEPVTTPAFHDATAHPGQNYRYQVTTVDARGNTSTAATADVFGPTP